METHPCWDQLPEFYHHWARELGHLTADGLEEWISALGLYEDEDLFLTNPFRDGKGALSTADAAVTDAAVADAGAVADATAGAAATPPWGAPPAPTTNYPQAGDLAETAQVEPSEPASRIADVLAYREFLRNEQWLVRWAGESAEESWERFGVLDSEPCRREADRLRAAASGRPSGVQRAPPPAMGYKLRERNPFEYAARSLSTAAVPRAIADARAPCGGSVHVYYDGADERERAMQLRARMQAAFPWMRFFAPKDRPIGPHPKPMWEADFGHRDNADQWGAVAAWLEAERDGLTVLIHPHSTDGSHADHTRHAFWAGDPLPLRMRE